MIRFVYYLRYLKNYRSKWCYCILVKSFLSNWFCILNEILFRIIKLNWLIFWFFRHFEIQKLIILYWILLDSLLYLLRLNIINFSRWCSIFNHFIILSLFTKFCKVLYFKCPTKLQIVITDVLRIWVF